MHESSLHLDRVCREYLAEAIALIDTRHLVEQCTKAAAMIRNAEVSEDLIFVIRSALFSREVADCRTDESWSCLLLVGAAGPGAAIDSLEWQHFFGVLALCIRCTHRSRHADLLLETLVDCVYQLERQPIIACGRVLRAVAESGLPLLGSRASLWAACAVLSARACAIELSQLSGELARCSDPGYQSLNSSVSFLDDEQAAHWLNLWQDVIKNDGGIAMISNEIRKYLFINTSSNP